MHRLLIPLLIPLLIVAAPTVALLIGAGGVFFGFWLADAVALGRWP